MCVNPKRICVYQIPAGTVKKKILANVQFTGDERLLPAVLHILSAMDIKKIPLYHAYIANESFLSGRVVDLLLIDHNRFFLVVDDIFADDNLAHVGL